MNRSERRKAKVQCSRCGERASIAVANNRDAPWNVTVRARRIVGHLCPNCQTPEENAEAEINIATTNYVRDPFGRLVGFPKIGASE